MRERCPGRDTRLWQGALPMLPAFVLGMAAFLTQFDVTAVVVAMPTIAGDLGFGVSGYAWVMDAYSLAFTGTLMAAGSVADTYGRRRALIVGNALFAVASVGCGLAWDGPSLWAARAFQGVGAAFVVTGAIALIAHAYPTPDRRTRAFALLGVLSGVAMALGPTVGGIIAQSLGWRWIFLLNLPICLLIIWGLPRLVGEARDAEARPFDPIGVLLLTLALGVTVETLLQARQGGPVVAVGLLLASALLLVGFVCQQRRHPHPVFEPAVFATPVMIGVAVLLVAVSVGYWAILVYLPVYLHTALHWSVADAGIGLLAATVPFLVVPPLAGRFAGRLGWRRFFGIGSAVLFAGNVGLALSVVSQDESTRLALILIGMVAAGSGAAWVHPQLTGAVVALVPPQQAGRASAATVVMRQGGFALGVAVIGASLGPDGFSTSFLASFALAAVASTAGAVAAMVLLPGLGTDPDSGSGSRD